ncbi:hypothetical protein PUNSTDRAFT_63495 [Punctularia strigosozonata HHB-11173 SS5]|uniref:uncharacterized protein n=1 Tax=Punctularia strigosozonata (strain HHB-11173) TaxID=741275 RepID=UPI0004417DFC|nr:uncharacterized protein PUNSTDRAFT_63495 [Punctularia strigosozonata HHB-11173 SS5]EIN11714.1 hypothetical protein PUNSTDRAFT_63495 [Punctularia strigosozonata HHB-11173 SS5]
MGNLIWHQYAHYVAITSSVYAVWSAYWGLFYRKFFWDFVAGTLRDPGGYQPAPSALPFVAVIVKLPVVQILAMIVGIFGILLEYPLPLFKSSPLGRNLVVRVVVLLVQTFFCILYYQGVNAALYGFIAAMCYVRAIMLGETMEEAKSNRGKGGRA